MLFGKEYQCIVWEKNLLWINLCWVQILGIENLEHSTIDQWKHELKHVQQKYDPLFIQLGSIEVLAVTSRKQLQDTSIVSSILQNRQTKQQDLINLWFALSNKENLPPSTYLVDINQTKEEHLQNLWSQHLQKIKKAQKSNIQISKATEADYEWFFTILRGTGKQKWFGVVSSTSYYNLLQRLSDNNAWWLYIAKQWNNILAGAIYIKDTTNQTAIYLYGATDRSYANIWASHLLHWNIWQILKNEWVHTIDLLGWAPTGDSNHYLNTVWLFKEWYGAKKVDFLWSFDIIYKPLLYKIWVRLRKIQH